VHGTGVSSVNTSRVDIFGLCAYAGVASENTSCSLRLSLKSALKDSDVHVVDVDGHLVSLAIARTLTL